MAQKIILLAVAGALGTLARYGLGGVVQRACGTSFPWGTVVVNLTGCLVFGVVWSIAASRVSYSAEIKLFVLLGFFGAFTTFSTLVYETNVFLAESQWLRAAANMIGQNVVGVLSLMAGMALGRYI